MRKPRLKKVPEMTPAARRAWVLMADGFEADRLMDDLFDLQQDSAPQTQPTAFEEMGGDYRGPFPNAE